MGEQAIRWNPYTYAGANPANYVDPTGEFFGLLVVAVAVGSAIAGWDLSVNQGYGVGGHRGADNLGESLSMLPNANWGQAGSKGLIARAATLTAGYAGMFAFGALPTTVTTLGTLSKFGIAGVAGGQAYRATDNALSGRTITTGLLDPTTMLADYFGGAIFAGLGYSANRALGGAFRSLSNRFGNLGTVQRFRAWDARVSGNLRYLGDRIIQGVQNIRRNVFNIAPPNARPISPGRIGRQLQIAGQNRSLEYFLRRYGHRYTSPGTNRNMFPSSSPHGSNSVLYKLDTVGNINAYVSYNHLNQPISQVHVTGNAHFVKSLGIDVGTPHTHEYTIHVGRYIRYNSDPRPSFWWEIP